MNKRESTQAERILSKDDWCERTERCGADTAGGWCVTAYWRDGGQQLFYLLDDVQRLLNASGRVYDRNRNA